MLILETKRMFVRRWSSADEQPLHAICSDPQVMRYVGDGLPWSRERTRQFIVDAVATEQQCGYCRWALVFREDNKLIGFCGFEPGGEEVEMGWRLASECWGRGLATEATQAVLNYGFETLGFRRVVATIQCGNDASLRVAQKIGMSIEKTIEQQGRQKLVLVATPATRSIES